MDSLAPVGDAVSGALGTAQSAPPPPPQPPAPEPQPQAVQQTSTVSEYA